VTCVEDILEVLGSPVGADRNVARGMPNLGHQETTVLDALGGDPRHVDELARLLGQSAGEVSATLALLELNGMARQVGGMLYTRA